MKTLLKVLPLSLGILVAAAPIISSATVVYTPSFPASKKTVPVQAAEVQNAGITTEAAA
ncbi:hypothetical protein ACE5JW_10500 [Acinetobacter radioresistens]|jgi:hypothetical protein|uniref:Uncharacterized protein n=1 Tax=Acinetobacter radioresistens SK82 TaxID=596318 RepID=A0ABP2GQW0_ACIRA|nr:MULTISPECIES: hypothetical protein [Acinetobacter]EET83842.1 hypothetical protein ACIRA0001_0357 [Acinetobacter radioresistens SK82]EEY86460.1 hypothetical protein HMPREF0018_01033 [Acinetobacter radioresistens SH164]ENV85038.1 hypothetical protein F940_02167 [Acinetobacter radioresistens NIPH 2130]EXB87636.1 hypothetical protein J538_0531 [Acinetobacter sp. 272263]EXE58080.1 hypothetical protein J579_1497 [Acinetobacter sp. 1239920]